MFDFGIGYLVPVVAVVVAFFYLRPSAPAAPPTNPAVKRARKQQQGAPADATGTSWDETTDVVIVGSGGAGMLSGIIAADNKLSSVIIEKDSAWGGTTSYSGGAVWVPCNHLFPEDSYDEARKYMDNIIGNQTPASTAARRDTFVRECPKMVSYLASKGFEWQTATTPDYYPEVEGGASGRAMEVSPFDAKKIGGDYATMAVMKHFKPDKMTDLLASTLPTTASGFAPTMKVSTKNMLTTMKYFAQSIWWHILGRAPVSMGKSLAVQLRYALNSCNDPKPEIRLETSLEDLVVTTDSSTGERKVEGIICTDKKTGETYTIKANKGVVFTAGGFARNKKYREEHQPGVGTDWTVVAPGDTGDALQIAVNHGAATDLMKYSWWTTVSPSVEGRQNFFILSERCLPSCIMVGPSGKRFANEACNYQELGQIMIDGKHSPGWLILDSYHRSRYTFGTFMASGAIPKELYDKKVWVKGNTIDELAQKCGLNRENLLQTIKKWNEYSETGKDLEFHRGDSAYDRYFGDPTQTKNPNLGPIQKAPFYAVRVGAGDIGTKGGLVTDEHSRVLMKKGEVFVPIKNFYASGNTTASVMGATYPGPGSTLGPALTFSYVGMNHLVNKNL